LGFHLASCGECRAYRTTTEQDLLAELLFQASRPAPTPAQPKRMPPIAPPPARAPRHWRALIGQTLWYAGIGTLALIVLLTIGTLGWIALAGFGIHRNVQAMIIPTEAATSLPSRPPTQIPAPTPTLTALPQVASTPMLPRPSATPLPTMPPPTATPSAPAAGAPVTVLLLGSDQRPGETGAARTDAIMIARIDPEKQRIALLSLPRDLWVTVPGYGQTRINSAHVWGIIYDDPEGGMGLARKTVSNLLGIPIDYAVYIDFQGFMDAIDSLGGVTVDVEKELYDEQFPTMDYGYTVAHFLPGPQQMDGATALMYSRIRHPDSDFARMRRQQAVLAGVLATMRQQNMLQELASLEDLTAALRGYVKTDMPEERIIGLAWALREFAPEQIEHYLLSADMITFGVGEDRYAEVADPGAIDLLVHQLIGQ
jgi:LCP family protein required for cell wall assembly